MIHIHDFCVDRPFDVTDNYPFGVSKEGLVAGLKNLVSLLEEGKVLPQAVTVTGKAGVEDFTTTTVNIVLAEKKDNSK